MGLHFIRPLWFFALIPLVFLLATLNKMSRQNNWQQVCDPHLLPHLLIEPNGSKHHWLLFSFGCAWLLAIIALTGPSFSYEKQSVYRSGNSRIIVMNLSQSMYQSEGSTTRLNRARFKIFDFLKREREGQTGLIVYSGAPFVVTPLTEDNNTIENLLPILDPELMPVSGNDTALALKEAAKLFKQAQVASGDILLVTDNSEDSVAAESAATELNRQHYRLFILDVSAVDNHTSPLTRLADKAQGLAIPVSGDNRDIEKLVKKMSAPALDEAKKTSAFATLWKDEGRWFALLIVPFFLLIFRRGFF